MTDAEAIRRSRTDPEAFRLVFERHFDAVWSYLRRRVGRTAADDLASDVFLAAFAARGRFRAEHDSALPWLYGIAANLVARRHRRETARLRAYAASGELPAEEIDVESLLGRLAAVERGRALAAALADLRWDERETLLLSAIAGLTHAEIAAALGISEVSSRQYLFTARKAMRSLLQEAGND